MKAKEYAEKFLANPDERDAQAKLGNGMIREFLELIKIRHAKAPRAIVSAAIEQNRKWKKVCELLAEKIDLTERGFYALCAMAIEVWPAVVRAMPLEEQELAGIGLLVAEALKKEDREADNAS